MEEDVWLFDSSKKTWDRKDLYEVYPELDLYVTGGATCKSDGYNHTFFFKSK